MIKYIMHKLNSKDKRYIKPVSIIIQKKLIINIRTHSFKFQMSIGQIGIGNLQFQGFKIFNKIFLITTIFNKKKLQAYP